MNTTEQFRAFKGIWIPKDVWLSGLSMLEKCLLAEIDSLSKSEKGCFASNQYFALFFGMSSRHIERALSNLKKRGLVKTKKFDGRVRFLEIDLSKITAIPRQVCHDIDVGSAMTNGVPEGESQIDTSGLTTNALDKEQHTPISKGITKDINKNTDASIKSNPELEKEKTQPPSSAVPLPIDDMNNKGWNKAVFSIWKEKCGGELPIHQLKAMKKLVDMFGWHKVKPAFEAYLAETEAMYVSVHSFASRFGIWESKVPKTNEVFGPR